MIINNKILGYLANIIILFLFVYSVPFTFLPANSSKLVVIILLGLYLLNKQKSNIVYKELITVILLISSLLVISFLYSNYIHKSGDGNVTYAYLLYVIEAIFGSYLYFKVFLVRFQVDLKKPTFLGVWPRHIREHLFQLSR